MDQLGFKYIKKEKIEFKKEEYSKQTLSGKQCYFIGEYFLDKNPQKSFEWYLISSKKLFIYSNLQLSKMLQNGKKKKIRN